MAKYQVGDKFISKNSESKVKSTILFVPPIDGYNKQYYLEEVYSVFENGGEKMFLNLTEEINIDKYFTLQ